MNGGFSGHFCVQQGEKTARKDEKGKVWKRKTYFQEIIPENQIRRLNGNSVVPQH